MEANHLAAVLDYQKIYEDKLEGQGSDYLSLEQSKLEMEKFYNEKINKIKAQNKESINNLLKEFKVNLNKVQEEYDESKKTSKDLKFNYKERLVILEGEHSQEIDDYQVQHIDQKYALQKKFQQYTEKQKTVKKDKERNEKLKKEAEDEMLKAKADKKDKKSKLEEKKKQISLLQRERQDNIDKLTKREKELYKYKFKIKDLQKSKHVLTHRTTEMKLSLQPKALQIE